MKITFSKALVGTVAAAAMATASASPAQARDRDRGIDAGDVIAGALIIGGIAAIASAVDNDRDDYRYRDRRYGYGDRDYDRRGYRSYDARYSPRSAVEQCVYAAERTASRYTRGRADVTDIRDVDRRGNGYRVKGRIAVDQGNRDWRRGWGNDWRGYNSRYSGYDSGKFTCEVRNGRVVDLDFSGIRGLR